jgi:hypothetical protein
VVAAAMHVHMVQDRLHESCAIQCTMLAILYTYEALWQGQRAQRLICSVI